MKKHYDQKTPMAPNRWKSICLASANTCCACEESARPSSVSVARPRRPRARAVASPVASAGSSMDVFDLHGMAMPATPTSPLEEVERILRVNGFNSALAALQAEQKQRVAGAAAPPAKTVVAPDRLPPAPQQQRDSPHSSEGDASSRADSAPAGTSIRSGSGSGRSSSKTDRWYTLEVAPDGDFATYDASAHDSSVVFFKDEVDEDEHEASERLDSFPLNVIFDPQHNGLEESVNFPIAIGTNIANKYEIIDYLGSGVFSRAVQCAEYATGQMVCIKVIRNNKDFLDQSLGEIKLLKMLNENDPRNEKHVLRIFDYFYFREHLFIVCELLRDNLYELYKYIAKSGWAPYFTIARVRSIGWQILTALEYLHSLELLHCDLKPENILLRSLSRCEVKLIDFGSSSFVGDPHSSYVQSRSYDAAPNPQPTPARAARVLFDGA